MRVPVVGTLGPVRDENKTFPPKSFSFSAAGWLKMYYWGVAKCLQVHGLAASENVKFSGSSAGSLAAAGLVVGSDFDKIKKVSLEKVDEVHGKFFPAFKLREYIRDVLRDMLKDGDEKRLNGRLEVCVTTIAPLMGARKYKNFSSVQDLTEALLASCCIPPFAGLPFVYRGELVFDGGLAQFQPIFDSQTVTVSAMYFSDADIKPSRYIPTWWVVYPPRREDFEWVFDLGYIDTISWLERNNAHNSSCRLKMGRTIFEAVRNGDKVSKPTEKESYSRGNACHLSSCRDQFTNRQESQLDRHERSFKRFFGYRSLWQVLPSESLDMFLLNMVTYFLRPLTFCIIYCEVIVISVLYFLRAVITSFSELLILVFWTLSLQWIFSSRKQCIDDEVDTDESWDWQIREHKSESGQLGVDVPLTWLSFEAWLQCWEVLRNLLSMLGIRRSSFEDFKKQLARQSTFARIAEHYY